MDEEIQPKKRFRRIREWMNDHPDAIAAGGLVVFYGAIVTVLYKATKNAVEREEQAQEERNRIISEAVNAGKQILPNPDGSFWVIEPRSHQEAS